MGLYLAIFDGDKELDGIEIGRYGDFGTFRDTVRSVAGAGIVESKFPVLMLHSDCDGVWTSEEAVQLKNELQEISVLFSELPPLKFEDCWQENLIITLKLSPNNLLDSFFDIDGMPLIERLIDLADLSIREKLPILFQ